MPFGEFVSSMFLDKTGTRAPASARKKEVLRGAVLLAVGFALGMLATLAARPARASQPTADEQRSMYLLAHSQAGLPLPEKGPMIHFTSQEQIRSLLGCGRCRPSGAQIREDVYVDEALDFSQAYEASILLHELVHYLQWAARGTAASCQEWLEREQRALAVQARVLMMTGNDTTRVRLSAQLLRVACDTAPP